MTFGWFDQPRSVVCYAPIGITEGSMAVYTSAIC